MTLVTAVLGRRAQTGVVSGSSGTLAALATMALAVTACTPAVESRPPTTTGQGVAQRDGITVSLTLDRTTTTPGTSVGAALVIRNTGPTAVPWRGNGCELTAPISVIADSPDEAEPVAPGPFDALREQLLRDAGRPAQPELRDRVAPDPRASCRRLDHGFSELAPGGVIRVSAVWPATTLLGTPAGPGTYRIDAEFPMLRGGAAIVPADFDARRDLDPVGVSVEFSVAADGPTPVEQTPGWSLDRILADRTVASLLAAQPGAWSTARLRYTGDEWRLTVSLADGAGLTATIDDSPFAAPTVVVAK